MQISRWYDNRKKRWVNWGLLFGLLVPNYGWGLRFRGRWVSPTLRRCGRNLKIANLVNIYNPSGLSVGNDVYIGHAVYLGDGEIELSDEVVIGPFCSITGGNHLFRDGSVRFGGYEYKPVRIGRGTWLGGHVSITAGVTVGSGCLIAAGAVVTRDIPDGMVAGGVPATILRPNEPSASTNLKKEDSQRA